MNKFDGYYRVIFDRMPDAPTGDCQFVELEDRSGRGVGSDHGARWVENNDTGFVELHIPAHPTADAMYEALAKMAHFRKDYSWEPGDWVLNVGEYEHILDPICDEIAAALALADEVNDE